jgi:hypothetical protein
MQARTEELLQLQMEVDVVAQDGRAARTNNKTDTNAPKRASSAFMSASSPSLELEPLLEV